MIETLSLGKRYGSTRALDGCSLRVERGEIFGLLGPNGAGKTTLLRLLLGFLKPTEGAASIDGLDCYRQSVDVHRLVSYLPGDARLFRRMNGHQTLRFFQQIRSQRDLSTSLAMADKLELDCSRRVSQMSTGMRQKLALSIALSSDAPLIILDEPTSNLDPTVRGIVTRLLRKARAAGQTVVFSSHVLSEVEEICDRVAILRNGTLAHMQIMSELRQRHRITARLTGPLPDVPEALEGELDIRSGDDGGVIITTPGELSPLLDWLGQLPIKEVRIEPVGLRTVYESYHGTDIR